MDSLRRQYTELIIESALNAGTFAEVYHGRLIDIKEQPHNVAVKVLKKKWIENEDLINRLEDEANLLNQLKHPNIIYSLGFMEVGGRPAIIMELIDGIDLQKLLKVSPIPPKIAFLIAAKIATALDSAYNHKLLGHDQALSVVHRDIKPSNVMLTQDQQIKVLDFGASRSDFSGRKGQTTVFQFGSPKYMSNERKKGDRGSHSSDIYSLGIMLIEMLSGKLLENIPPNSQKEHNIFIQQLISNLHFGLPDAKWELAAKQVISRMCSFWKMHRIRADQCIGRLQKFSAHASGEDISSFWNRVVVPLSEKKHKKSKSGPLTGRTIVIQAPRFHDELPMHIPPTPEQKEEREQRHPIAAPPIVESPPPTNLKESFRLSSRSRMILYALVSASLSFSFLNAATFLGLAIANKKNPLFPFSSSEATTKKEQKEEPEEEQEKLYKVRLSMERDVFSSAKIRSRAGEIFLHTKRTRTTDSNKIPAGEYLFEIKYQGDSKVYYVEYEIDANVEIFCGNSDGKNNDCTDHNNNVLINKKSATSD